MFRDKINLFKKVLVFVTVITFFVPSLESRAGIVIGLAVPGGASALCGLGMVLFSSTLGIRAGIHPGLIGVMVVLDKDIDNSLDSMKIQLVLKFGLKDNLIDVILDYIKLNIADSKVIHNADGSRTVVLLPDQLSDVMLKATDHGLSGEMLDNLRSFLSDIPTQLELDVVRESLSNRQ